ncbi:hypothetical protein [Candidatus Enterovibrio altilux]|uniref:hypothetical protein n=1 Tax=Candidatus Enterovibrio altilux TaxID=1927128 RepID=UPI001237CDCA|nr:hypothetical protein [Candidatus Enterovibrio luxaltus]
MLKLAGFLEIESCYLSNDAGDIKRQKLRESGASLDEIKAIPRIYSQAAFKRFTPAFKQVFAFMLDAEDMMKSKIMVMGYYSKLHHVVPTRTNLMFHISFVCDLNSNSKSKYNELLNTRFRFRPTYGFVS